MKSYRNMLLTATACALASGSAVASDEEKTFSYSYIEGAFVHDNFTADGVALTDQDGDGNIGTFESTTGNGGAGRLSLELPVGNQNFGMHIVSDYLQTNHNVGVSIVSLQGITAGGVVSTDQKEWRVALGTHAKIGKNASFFAELGIVRNTVDFASASLTISDGGSTTADLGVLSGKKTALDAKLGLRAMVTDRLELTGYARYHGNGDITADAAGHAVDFDAKIKAGAGAFYHFSKRFAVGLDYEFGKPGRARAAVRLSF